MKGESDEQFLAIGLLAGVVLVLVIGVELYPLAHREQTTFSLGNDSAAQAQAAGANCQV